MFILCSVPVFFDSCLKDFGYEQHCNSLDKAKWKEGRERFALQWNTVFFYSFIDRHLTAIFPGCYVTMRSRMEHYNMRL